MWRKCQIQPREMPQLVRFTMFGINDWILLLATLFGIILFYYWKKTQYFKERNVVAAETIPVFGNTLRPFLQLGHIKDLFDSIYYKFPNEKYVGMFTFSTPIVLVKDPDLLRQISIKDFDHFTDHVEFVDPEVDPLTGKMLFLLKGEQWREMRNTLSPAFTSSKIRGMFPLMQECSDYLVQYLDNMFTNRLDKEKEYLEIEIKDVFTKCTNDIIATCGFGIKTNSLVDSDNTFYKMSKSFVNLDLVENLKFGLYMFLPFVLKIFQIQFGKKEVNGFFRRLITSNFKEREEKNIVRQDMVNLLLLAKQGKLTDETVDGNGNDKRETKLEWSDEEMISQVLVFLFAGFESTATMISFVAYELAKDVEVQRRLQDEIDELLENSNGKLDYEGINSLKYLDMVCSETLRLWPVAPNTDRVCTKLYELPQQSDDNPTIHKMSKGDQIWIPTMSIQRDPKYFPDPEKFDPERFSEENKHSIKPFTYFPFGLGPRQCIGTRFALMEVKLLVANLLINYDVIKIPKTPDPMVLRHSLFDMIALDGFWVGLKPRKAVTLN